MREYLKNLRNVNNLTQLNVASKLNITESSYNLIENRHRRKNLSLPLIEKFSEIFDVPVSKIIEEESKLREE